MSEKINTRKASEILKVSEVTLRSWAKKGIGPKRVWFGGRVFYNLDDVNEYARKDGRELTNDKA